MIVCGDIELNQSPGSDRSVRVLYFNIRGPHANLDELTVAGSGYDVLVWLSLKSLIAAISQSSISLALVAKAESEEPNNWCPGYGSLC